MLQYRIVFCSVFVGAKSGQLNTAQVPPATQSQLSCCGSARSHPARLSEAAIWKAERNYRPVAERVAVSGWAAMGRVGEDK
jgi:hypothetical protein